ncbi:hypothetical protein E1301_Tti022005 [Triplophysa tibetana]|uniref:Uncharacterized protein n=1 Tax=Triplophysa tibetana TaxID=1572043 RepID=A0A5A9NEN8_9TELE|nr:hypothetical protein E1301_Tti022005 [Triplophysa tibetana]
MGKLRELEASNPAIPMVTLKDEPLVNSGNPIAPETLTINTHPSSPDLPATPSFSSSLTPSYEPAPPPIITPSPPSTAYGGGFFSPLLFSEDELNMFENLDIPTITLDEEKAIANQMYNMEVDAIKDLGFSMLMDL